MGDDGMAAQSNGRPGIGSYWAFAATVAWIVALMAVVIVLFTMKKLDSDAAAIILGVTAAITPITLSFAWRMRGEGGGGVGGGGAGGVMGMLGDQRTQQMRELLGAVQTMAQEGGLSESAKRVLHRREERELLRRAIEQDIMDEDWDAAMVLVKELAERFGYRADAEEFRARVERARAQTLDRRVVEELTRLDEQIRNRRWPEAYSDAARITRLYPDSHRVDALRERVDEARMRYRMDLERRFLLAADHGEVDEAMEMLKELDLYLTPSEAAPFQEVARGVIGKLRENQGARFKLAVQDHLWGEAIIIGEQIMRDFPNTRMAQEVRDLMPSLRERGEGRVKAEAGR